MISWVFYVAIGLIVGGGAGFFLARLDDFSKKERQAMQEKLDKADKQMADYKHEVTEHFIQTAGLINTMTESYQAVHEHLAKGALSLCDHQVAVKRLQVTTAESLEKADDKTIDTNAIETVNEKAATDQRSAQEALQQHATESKIPGPSASRQSTQQQSVPEKKAKPESEELDEFEQEQAEIKVQEVDKPAATRENQTEDMELTESDQQTDEQKALAEKQAAAMASRMVH